MGVVCVVCVMCAIGVMSVMSVMNVMCGNFMENSLDWKDQIGL